MTSRSRNVSILLAEPLVTVTEKPPSVGSSGGQVAEHADAGEEGPLGRVGGPHQEASLLDERAERLREFRRVGEVGVQDLA